VVEYRRTTAPDETTDATEMDEARHAGPDRRSDPSLMDRRSATTGYEEKAFDDGGLLCRNDARLRNDNPETVNDMRRIHTRITRLLAALLLLGCLSTSTGCDYTLLKEDDQTNPVGPGSGGNGGTGDSSRVAIAVSPTEVVVATGQAQQFTATVTGSSDSSAIWTIASGVGTIGSNGQYIAPSVIPSDTIIVIVKAISVADPRASATATVSVVRTPSTGDTTGSGGNDTTGSGEVCFEREVLPIFQSNCAMSGCHASPGQDGYIFTSYETILRKGVDPGRPFNSEIFEKITEDRAEKRMPPPPRTPLTDEQIETIRRWIAEGAKNTKCSGTGGGCDTTNVTFAAVVRPILQNNCTGCHSGSTPPANVRLDSYGGARTVALDGRLYGVISHSPGYPQMPYNGNKLDDCRIAKIKAWIDMGAPDN